MAEDLKPVDRVDVVADHICHNWRQVMGPGHLYTEGGCAMHQAIAALAMQVVPSFQDYLEMYVAGRGIPMPFYDSGSKITEEAEELRTAVRSRDANAVRDEAADVAITAMVACRQFGFTLEESLNHKIAKDRGRGPKVTFPHSYSPDYEAMGDCRVCGRAASTRDDPEVHS